MRQKLELIMGVTQGMMFLHDNDIVHRDLKPGNVLLLGTDRRRLRAKVSDFGGSKDLIRGHKERSISTEREVSMTANVGTPGEWTPSVASVDSVYYFLVSGLQV
jgi:serine/threonine protein kinase